MTAWVVCGGMHHWVKPVWQGWVFFRKEEHCESSIRVAAGRSLALTTFNHGCYTCACTLHEKKHFAGDIIVKKIS